ncbi:MULTISPECIES: DUF397 domain-containing protein [Actinomadura]|uniref:DUF397 domain-containing protein n=2 Tax=Actinomadura yumaensis TaxID=111807 RepID=A0ABW2CWB1_9ACTN|nr:DUF397 domain-containing protein [Actinomadura sp. J1-007]
MKWRKSSYSGNGGADCVEVGRISHNIGVRDSKDPDGPRLALSPDAWQALVEHLKRDDTA